MTEKHKNFVTIREMFCFTDLMTACYVKPGGNGWLQREPVTKKLAAQATNGGGLTFCCYLFTVFLYPLLDNVNEI
jgi:hypothetical protein